MIGLYLRIMKHSILAFAVLLPFVFLLLPVLDHAFPWHDGESALRDNSLEGLRVCVGMGGPQRSWVVIPDGGFRVITVTEESNETEVEQSATALIFIAAVLLSCVFVAFRFAIPIWRDALKTRRQNKGVGGQEGTSPSLPREGL